MEALWSTKNFLSDMAHKCGYYETPTLVSRQFSVQHKTIINLEPDFLFDATYFSEQEAPVSTVYQISRRKSSIHEGSSAFSQFQQSAFLFKESPIFITPIFFFKGFEEEEISTKYSAINEIQHPDKTLYVFLLI